MGLIIFTLETSGNQLFVERDSIESFFPVVGGSVIGLRSGNEFTIKESIDKILEIIDEEDDYVDFKKIQDTNNNVK
ncbi:hypothetical protein NYQ10_16255 [Flavobacterium johnsoniae]|uniref:hypothetical protein n=1 Tax=Flavobacterium johnsoniae TaxID=986 RepID=UPI0025B1832C|nr:hypothetical protein [Flavobacterium johnsoniae]WJS93645.1 hypothetical protein NYQ10_16255 [Flavobacterium johnsoniae]